MQARKLVGGSSEAVITPDDARKSKVQLVKTFKLMFGKTPDLFDLIVSNPVTLESKNTSGLSIDLNAPTPSKKVPAMVKSPSSKVASILSPKGSAAAKKPMFGVFN